MVWRGRGFNRLVWRQLAAGRPGPGVGVNPCVRVCVAAAAVFALPSMRVM
jgi:hypothetical protein